MSEVIRLENVVKVASDGRRVVNSVSFAVNERERVEICGTPGSGKSALMRLIAGMDAPDSGQVFVMGRAVHDMVADEASDFRNKTMGVCLRNPSLMPSLTVWENVALPLAILGMPASQREKAAMEQLKAMGISHAAHARPSRLSPYEARLASIARALVAKPSILLMDEISVDLPERQEEQIGGVLRALLQFSDATVLLFTATESACP